MRRSYIANSAALMLLIVDLLIAAASVTFAYAIRANFQDFLLEADRTLVLAVLVVGLRAGVHLFFEHYAYSPTVWRSKDILALFVHNLIPTALLVLFRYFSPAEALRFPLSILLMEYWFSVSLMVLYRAVHRREGPFDGQRPRYRPRILVYGEVQEIKESPEMCHLLQSTDNRVVAILSPNPLHWDTDLHGYRVVGDEESMSSLLSADDSISAVHILQSRSIPRARIERVRQYTDGLALSLHIITPAAEGTD